MARTTWPPEGKRKVGRQSAQGASRLWLESLRGRLITIIIGGTNERASLGGSERPSIFESSVGGFVFACFQRAPFSLASERPTLSSPFKRAAFSTSCRARCHAVETPDEHRYEVNKTRVGHSSPSTTFVDPSFALPLSLSSFLFSFL